MSYVAIATNDFERMTHFYEVTLNLGVETQWNRPRGRGIRFDAGGGLRLEVLDNMREPRPLRLRPRCDDTHVVIEVDDIDAAHARLPMSTPPPRQVSWGARLFDLRDPCGMPVTVLQWTPDAHPGSGTAAGGEREPHP